jgi:hypothetical protein
MDLHETISKAACEPSIDQGVTKVFKTKFTFRFRLVRTLAQEMNIATKRTAIIDQPMRGLAMECHSFQLLCRSASQDARRL